MPTLSDVNSKRWWAMVRNTAKTARLTAEERALLEKATQAEALGEAMELLQSGAADDDSLESELREIQNGKVRVSRKSNKQGSPGGYLFTVGSDEMSLDDLFDKIRREYGGGEYRLRVTRSSGAFAVNRDISIAEPLSAPVVAAAPPPQSDDRLASILISMQENNRLLMDSMRQQQLAQAESMQTVFVEIIRAQAQREPAPAAPQQSPTDMLAMMGMFKELFGAEKHADPMKVFLQGVDFAKKMTGDGGDENPVIEMLKTLAPPLLAIAQQQGAPAQRMALAPPQQPPQRAPAQPPVQGAGVVVTNQSEVVEMSVESSGAGDAVGEDAAGLSSQDAIAQLSAYVAPYISILTTAASVDADPETYADMVLDIAPHEQVLAVVENDALYNELLSGVPGIEQTREWFDQLRACLVELIADEQQIDNGGDDVPGGAGSKDIPDSPVADVSKD